MAGTSGRRRFPRRAVLRTAALSAAGAAAAACTDSKPKTDVKPSPTARSSAPAATPNVPGPDSYRAEYHFTAPTEWKNDPQRPLYVDGTYLYYYLYNRDYIGGGNGTEWRLATTKDNVTFQDEGVAIPKFTTRHGDVWSGSAVVDTENTAGYGRGAVVAVVTQQDAGKGKAQAQFLWYSKDGGRTFSPDNAAPVLPNPGTKDFRDPKVVRDTARNRWLMLLAEGNKIGFYTSANLREWTYASGFVRDDLGVLECPDLFRIETADGRATWILGVSANGTATGRPATYAYWTGDFDGTAFRPDHEQPQWLDHGFDWYAAVTWEKYRDGKEDPTTRYALAWMNNWAYAQNTPTTKADGFNGTDSIVREITLGELPGGGFTLLSRPVDALGARVTDTRELGDIKVEGEYRLDFDGRSYELSTEVSWDAVENVGMRLRTSRDGKRHVDVGVLGDHTYVNRAGTGDKDRLGRPAETHAPFPAGQKRVKLRVLVDRASVEVFVDDGRWAHSHLVFPHPQDTGVTLYALGGSATFADVRIRAFTPSPQGPRPR